MAAQGSARVLVALWGGIVHRATVQPMRHNKCNGDLSSPIRASLCNRSKICKRSTADGKPKSSWFRSLSRKRSARTSRSRKSSAKCRNSPVIRECHINLSPSLRRAAATCTACVAKKRSRLVIHRAAWSWLSFYPTSAGSRDTHRLNQSTRPRSRPRG
jgi:hypothetical protein